MYRIICARCGKDLQIIRDEKVMFWRMVVYGGVVCTKCQKVECIVCKGDQTTDIPCSWCGSKVNPVFNSGMGPNVQSEALR